MRIIHQNLEMDVDESSLARTLGFEDRPDTFVLWVEWRLDDVLVRRDAYPLPKTLSEPFTWTTYGSMPTASLVRTVELVDTPSEMIVVEVFRLDEEIVKRSVHVVMKQASVIADAVAAAIG